MSAGMMHWHRGFLRLWATLSVLWVLLAGSFFIYMFKIPDPAVPLPELPEGFEVVDPDRLLDLLDEVKKDEAAARSPPADQALDEEVVLLAVVTLIPPPPATTNSDATADWPETHRATRRSVRRPIPIRW